MSMFNVTISPESILAQKQEREQGQKRSQNKFDEKNYLQVRLGPNEDKKEITIRLLPYEQDGGTPFHEIFMHQVRVNKEVSASGWKRFPCPIKNGFGDKCPFCETAQNARSLKKSTLSEADKKKYSEIEMMNYPKSMWVVRCIERGHEEDGVKFWLFSISKQKDGVYEKIDAIYNKRMEKGRNIFDLNHGKDLCLTLSKSSDGKTKIAITDDEDYTPLTEDFELGMSWIQDPKKWTDVYTIKPYDYMAVIVQGGVPYFSRELNTYVDKDEHIAKEKKEIEDNLTQPTKDFSNPVEEIEKKVVMNVNLSDDDDDDALPF